MRICLLGDFSGNPDEGMKNVSKNIRKRMSLEHDILALNSNSVFTNTFLKSIRMFKPEIIHYLHGPTIRSLSILKIAKLMSGNNANTVCSATKPYFSKMTRHFLPLLRPDLILTQSLIWEEFFEDRGFQVKFFPNGVDTSKFSPATEDAKHKLRKKWGISYDKFVVLHVGHIRRNRNLEVFKQLQEIPRLQVVIVGGTTNPADESLKGELISTGCKVYHHYISDIYELYKTADLYIFSTKYQHNRLPLSYNEIGAVDMPLSVLEAMSTNLPLLTTKFGALARVFKQNASFQYFDNAQVLIAMIEQMKSIKDVNTRRMVTPYDWKSIAERLSRIYMELSN